VAIVCQLKVFSRIELFIISLIPTVMTLVQEFKYVRILEEDPLVKRLVILGQIRGDDAILTLEKTWFADYTKPQDSLLEVDLIANNDVYFWGHTLAKQDLQSNPSCKFNLIYPASETHIRKYEKAVLHMIKETPEAYENIVKPYIETMKGERLQWVKNILYHGAESERVLFKNNEYVLLPDMKWDGKDINTLYCCCIVYDASIASIRDLNKFHIDYLKRTQESLLEEIPKIYAGDGLQRDNLRLYIHYQPSYYHFHIHVVNSNFLGLSNSMLAGKAILLDDVIDNLQFLGEKGYAQKVLNYQLKETHALWSLGLKDYAQ
jgi:m7GpppX diphosphatase